MTRDEDTVSRKRAVRAAMKTRLAGVPSASFDAEGRSVAVSLAELPQWRAARSVSAFLSMSGEIVSDYAGESALSSGKSLYIPRVSGPDIAFFECATLDGPWNIGPFGIREPSDSAGPVDFSQAPGPLIVLVPGLAFDPRGGRLGRGKGYYDRFLGSLRSMRSDVYAIGLCLDEQIVADVPVDASDERLDAVLSGLRTVLIG